MRSREQIQADLDDDVVRSINLTSTEYGESIGAGPIGRLVNDVPELLAELAERVEDVLDS